MRIEMNEDDLKALDAKRKARTSIVVDNPQLLGFNTLFNIDLGSVNPYNNYQSGSILNLESIRLQWISPDYFVFIPRKENKFAFKRHSGEVITPLRMFTDGGSIPTSLQFLGGVTSWGYAPAYLIHDWLFDLHHCHMTEYSFDDVRDILMEAIKTLMELSICPKSETSFLAVYSGVNSYVAKQIWNKQVHNCPLPPNKEE